MRYRRLVNGDYSFGHNAQDFLTDTLAVSQAIKTRLLFFQAEWWEDATRGLPMFQSILGQLGTPENKDAADMLVRQEILATPGVESISNLISVLLDRHYTFICNCKTIYGPAEVEVIF